MTWNRSPGYNQWLRDTDGLGCGRCSHLEGDGTCAAYPEGIPLIIANGDTDHMVERPDQVPGILFELKEVQSAAR